MAALKTGELGPTQLGFVNLCALLVLFVVWAVGEDGRVLWKVVHVNSGNC